ncbi:hypothetical protein E1176_12475 [Fulvivirga sp. RKSG066]|uniref:tetratricopeptide repeat protein n=1 Tax=Fulvivirga aurantia TaxID=2529383 RepID=UPI0012BC4B94|nr:hypothetical protein [Fulvivirga aurantia]MTI21839.1 hypothetical protein [Fulvivirga aurantia]
MFKQFYTLLFSILAFGCTKTETAQTISDPQDYQTYLDNEKTFRMASYTSDVAFWTNKIEQQQAGYIYIQKLAALKSAAFDQTGEVSYLNEVDSLYREANQFVSGKRKANNLIALSSNAIKQHKFEKALEYAYAAMKNTDEKFGPSLMVYDAAMELGLYDLAGRMIKSTKDLESFDYLVRLSKFQDYKGDLDSAISLMETAFEQVDQLNNPTAHWAQANLADMYGHAGEIQKSYNGYLAVLKKNPDYDYALKGIAWVAYAHDDKPEEALEIISQLVDRKKLPDHHLLLAELADYQNNKEAKAKHIEAFVAEAKKAKYDGMYNSYLITLYAEEYQDYDMARSLALTEVDARPTPMTYSLLAWVFEQEGNHERALEIIQKHVEGKSYEPDLIYKTAVIYASNNKDKEAKEYFLEAKEAAYELGPIASRDIDKYLNTL